MRIGVLGAGSIGCYFAGHLAATGAAEVVLVGRERQRAALEADGLTVRDPEHDDLHAPGASLHFATEPTALVDCDAVLSCVKSAHTRPTAESLQGVLPTAVPVFSLQNGVSNVPTLREVLPEHTIVPAIVTFNVVMHEGGLAARGTSGPLQLEATGAHVGVAEAVGRTRIEVEVFDDLLPHQWTKLLVNLNNAVSALSDAPTATLITDSGYRRLIADLTDEALAVLRAADIEPAPLWGIPIHWLPRMLRLPTPVVRFILRKRLKVDPGARSSMWQDLDRGKTTEVDFLNGEIVALAEHTGAAAPMHRRIVQLVHDAEEAGVGSPGLSPDALRAALTAA